MPQYDRFYIGAPSGESFSGQITRYKSFILPSGAYELLRNMYVYREVVVRRPGALVMDTSVAQASQQFYTRLRINLGPTVAGALAGTVPGAVFKIGQAFSIGTAMYTVITAGVAQAMLETVATTTATYSTTNGAFAFVGAPAGDVFFYPSEALMHYDLLQTATTLNQIPTIAFDTQFAYTYTAGSGWARLGTGANATWTTDANKNFYYWSTNYRGAADYDYTFYVTNNVAADAMRYYDATNWNAWGSLATTPLGGGAYIVTCRVILQAPDTLLLMNTLEYDGATNRRFVNRIRYSAPTTRLAPTNAGAWLVANKAGFIDLPTKEAITSAYNIKDVIIIECERSVYRLSITGNELSPFIVEQINAELGVESVNSMVGFDDRVIGFGSTGIHACNGQNAARVDEAIPSQIFDVSNTDSGAQRVQGVRDYFNEMAYWTFNSTDEQTTYNLIWPNRVLIQDYNLGSWAQVDDSISALGYFYKQVAAGGQQIGFQSVICGNQEGWTFRLRDDTTRNSSSLQITDISRVTVTFTFTVIDHNLTNQSYVYIDNVIGTAAWQTALNGNIFQVTTTSTSQFTITLSADPGAGTYDGGGTLERVSEPEILTKEYNFYSNKSYNMALIKTKLYVEKTTNGEFTLDFYSSSSTSSMLTDAQSTGAILGNNIVTTAPYDLVPLEDTQVRFWRVVGFNVTGEVVQIKLYLSDAQLRDKDGSDYVAFQDIQINGMIYYTRPVEEMY